MKIYLASSWRNKQQPEAVRLLREAGHEVYDFRNPPGRTGFSWEQCVGEPRDLTDPQKFRDNVLKHQIAQDGFFSDMDALMESDVTILLLPCGRSAHLELGWASGADKVTIVILDNPLSEPELMYLMIDYICLSVSEAIEGPLKKITAIMENLA